MDGGAEFDLQQNVFERAGNAGVPAAGLLDRGLDPGNAEEQHAGEPGKERAEHDPGRADPAEGFHAEETHPDHAGEQADRE